MPFVIPSLLATLLGAALSTGSVPAQVAQANVSKLPDVDVFLGKASGKALDFATQAAEMQARLASSQTKHREAIAEERSKFERKLNEQAEHNHNISDENVKLGDSIRHLELHNSHAEGEAAQLQAQNEAMRKVMTSMSEKVGAAGLFMSDTLKVTDDTNAEALKFLAPTTPRPTLEHLIRSAAASDLGSSLLQVGSVMTVDAIPKLTRRDDPVGQDLVKVLSASLADISNAEEEAVATLNAFFMEKFSTGELLTRMLLKQQVELNQTKGQLLTQKAELARAKWHLSETHKQLVKRFQGLHVFASTVDQAAEKALNDAPEGPVKPANASFIPLGALAAKTPLSVILTTVTTSTAKPVTTQATPAKTAPPRKYTTLLAAAKAHVSTTIAPVPMAPKKLGQAPVVRLSTNRSGLVNKAAAKPQVAKVKKSLAVGGTKRGFLRNVTVQAVAKATTGSADVKPQVQAHAEKHTVTLLGTKDTHAKKGTADSLVALKDISAKPGLVAKKSAVSVEKQTETPAEKPPTSKESHAKGTTDTATTSLRPSKQAKSGASSETGGTSAAAAKEGSWKTWISSWR